MNEGGLEQQQPETARDEQVWGNGWISRTFRCLPFAVLVAWILIDDSLSFREMWLGISGIGFLTVLWLRLGVRMTKDELILRYPIGSQRLARTDVLSAKFNTYGLTVHTRDGRRVRAFLTPKMSSTEISGNEPETDSAAYQITQWAQRADREDTGHPGDPYP